MKIRLISDVHMEINDEFYLYNDVEPCDILIISGDFTVANYFNKSINSPYYSIAENSKAFLARASSEYEHVFYIPGNHEHYRGYFDETDEILERELAVFNNVHYLQNKSFEYKGFKFIGGTLWTSCYHYNPIAMNTLRFAMNDYRIVQVKNQNYRKFTPDDSIAAHFETLAHFEKEVANCDKAVIISHHAPSFQSVHPRYYDDYYLNSGYYTDLESFILNNPQIKLWAHGHMHNNSDYMIGDTRVCCNPHGYGGENKQGFQWNGVIEL